MRATCPANRWKQQRRANLDRFSTKHALPPIPLKNHLDIATLAPGKPPKPKAL